jgi:hypothetical protein
MGTIKGMEYSQTRYNEDEEKEYYIDDWGDWYTVDDIKREQAEQNYWLNDYANEVYESNGGFDWGDD